MSTTVKPTSDPLWHGEDVTISDVLDALRQGTTSWSIHATA